MKRNSCHNHEPYDPVKKYWAQDGFTEDGRRKLVEVVTPYSPIQCTHLLAESDPACSGCHWLGWEG